MIFESFEKEQASVRGRECLRKVLTCRKPVYHSLRLQETLAARALAEHLLVLGKSGLAATEVAGITPSALGAIQWTDLRHLPMMLSNPYKATSQG